MVNDLENLPGFVFNVGQKIGFENSLTVAEADKLTVSGMASLLGQV